MLVQRIALLQSNILTAQAALAASKATLADAMGAARTVTVDGLIARKWPQVAYSVDAGALMAGLPAEVLAWFRELVLTKEKLDQALRAGVISQTCYDEALTRTDKGWVVSVQEVK